jgi:branched-chain amino acid transport system permease protein
MEGSAMGVFLQTVVNGFVNGSLLALLTLAFGLVVGTTGRFHWAMAASFMGAALVTALLTVKAGVAFPIAALAGLIVAALLGMAIETFAYRPLLARATGPAFMSIFLTSLGIVIIAENATRVVFGNAGYFITGGFQKIQSLGIHIGDISFAALDAVFALVAWGLIAIVWGALNFTSWGRSTRAVRTNPTMSRVVGIDPDGVYMWVFILGSLLAGAAGIMTGIRQSVLADMGTAPMFYAFVAAFVAGSQSGPIRFAVAGLLVGLLASVSTNWISVAWAPAVVFAVLFLYIAIRAISGARGGRATWRSAVRRLTRRVSEKG